MGGRRLAIATLFFVAACGGGPAPGSEEDLAGRIDALELPPTLRPMGEIYTEECPGTCPAFVRWYASSSPAESIREDVVARLEASGVPVNEASASRLAFAASDDESIFFVVLDTAMMAANKNAPPGADLEIVVQLRPSPGP